MLKTIVSAIVCILICTASFAAEQTDYRLIVSGFHSLYSPSKLNGRLWVGGWMESPKAVPWPDKIYTSQLGSRGNWSLPVPIKIRQGINLNLKGEKRGFHINDPSILLLENMEPNRLLLFYTAFPNDAIDPLACNPALNPVDCLDVRRHSMGMMESFDNGDTWDDGGIVLSHPDGVWSASVIYLNNELWVYYMDAIMPLENSNLYLQRLAPTFDRRLGPRTKIQHPGNGIGNPDVHLISGKFILVGNRKKASQVIRYESVDGYRFTESRCWQNPLVEKPEIRLDGPSVYHSAKMELQILTGYNSGKGSDKIVSWSIISECESPEL